MLHYLFVDLVLNLDHRCWIWEEIELSSSQHLGVRLSLTVSSLCVLWFLLYFAGSWNAMQFMFGVPARKGRWHMVWFFVTWPFMKKEAKRAKCWENFGNFIPHVPELINLMPGLGTLERTLSLGPLYFTLFYLYYPYFCLFFGFDYLMKTRPQPH